jgi:hypothetical protein
MQRAPLHVTFARPSGLAAASADPRAFRAREEVAMTTTEIEEIQRISWTIEGITRKLNKVARDMHATTDEITALREDFGIQPQRPRLELVDAEEGDDA